jgi:hypothetical protein
MSRAAAKAYIAAEDAVIDAAREYVREIENPVPDYAYRAHCRKALVESVEQLGSTSPATSILVRNRRKSEEREVINRAQVYVSTIAHGLDHPLAASNERGLQKAAHALNDAMLAGVLRTQYELAGLG